jgi:hypothetical protein
MIKQSMKVMTWLSRNRTTVIPLKKIQANLQAGRRRPQLKVGMTSKAKETLINTLIQKNRLKKGLYETFKASLLTTQKLLITRARKNQFTSIHGRLLRSTTNTIRTLTTNAHIATMGQLRNLKFITWRTMK